jgi:hypothetical protein
MRGAIQHEAALGSGGRVTIVAEPMASSRSPQLGYNHNIPHRGRLYHVQTEDSGVDKAHIFTHVFYDGTIIASNKVEYADRLATTDVDATVVRLMQASHKDMIRRLRGGLFDEKIVSLVGAHPLLSDRLDEGEPAPVPTPTPAPRPVARAPEPPSVGPPLRPGPPGPTVDPGLFHPVLVSPAARAHEPADTGRTRRRPVRGIGGEGVRFDAPVDLVARRDVIVGKFASEHQVQLDEEILALLRQEG